MSDRERSAGPPGATGKPVDKIVRRKLSDEVFDRLRQMIHAGELGPGDPMPSERDLMQRFGVGRPAVREALQSMQTMGLITISHGGRSRVNALSAASVLERTDAVAQILLSSEPSQLRYLKEARRMFETGMVRLAAERASAKDLAELRDIVNEQRGLLGDPESFMRADMRFHTRIAETSGNPIMGAVSDAMLRWLLQYYTDLLHWSGHERTTLVEHEKILGLIALGNADAAATAMQAHLDRSDEMLRQKD